MKFDRPREVTRKRRAERRRKQLWTFVNDTSNRKSPDRLRTRQEKPLKGEQGEGIGNGCGPWIGTGGMMRLEKTPVSQDEGFLSDTFGIYHQYRTVSSLLLMPSQPFDPCKMLQTSPVNTSMALSTLPMCPSTGRTALADSIVAESNEMHSPSTELER